MPLVPINVEVEVDAIGNAREMDEGAKRMLENFIDSRVRQAAAGTPVTIRIGPPWLEMRLGPSRKA